MDNLKSLEVRMDGRVVGTLALTDDALCAFEYDAQWIADGFSISPFELPLKQGVLIAKRTPFEGGFGVFDDSLPDGWGLLIMDRYLQKQGVNIHKLNILDRLALVGKSGRGALEFYPDRSVEDWSTVDSYGELAHKVETILGTESYNGTGIDEMYRRGGSPGGARPKLFVRAEGTEWLVKFPAKNDPQDIGVNEFHYAGLSKRCGIEMMDCRLFENRYFGTKRFDRTSSWPDAGTSHNGKLHVISMAGLLCADYRIPCMDYAHIFQAASKLTHSIAELWKVYRLMCFNYLIGNKDGHAKNFAFIYRCGEWHFAPAYDLLPSDGLNGYHTTSINDSITPQDSDLLNMAARFGLDNAQAGTILHDIRFQITHN